MQSMGQREGHPNIKNLSIDGENHFGEGHQGVLREHMPQIPRAKRADFIKGMSAKVAILEVDPFKLRPTQNEIDGKKVGLMYEKIVDGTFTSEPIIVSKDYTIIDGHHTWAAKVVQRAQDTQVKMTLAYVDMPHKELMALAQDFTDKNGIVRKDITKFDLVHIFKAGTSIGAAKAWGARQNNALPDTSGAPGKLSPSEQEALMQLRANPDFAIKMQERSAWYKRTLDLHEQSDLPRMQEAANADLSNLSKGAIAKIKSNLKKEQDYLEYLREGIASRERILAAYRKQVGNGITKFELAEVLKGTSAGASLAWASRGSNDLPDIRAINFTGRAQGQGWKMADGTALSLEVATTLKRIGSAIPPAWTGVQVNINPNAKAIVRGTDAKGKIQALYSTEHMGRSSANKFARVAALQVHIPKVLSSSNKDMTDTSLSSRERDDAATVNLVLKTGFRPGSTTDTGAAEQAYGASTLEKRHIKLLKDNTIHFTFVGKKGVAQDKYLRDKRLHEYLTSKMPTLQDTDFVFASSGASAGKYLKSIAGAEFKLKDLRTWNGTALARKMVNAYEPPKNEAEFKALQNTVGDAISVHLGNTRAIAIKAYIDPAVNSLRTNGHTAGSI